jgi:hypothetical protein
MLPALEVKATELFSLTLTVAVSIFPVVMLFTAEKATELRRASIFPVVMLERESIIMAPLMIAPLVEKEGGEIMLALVELRCPLT